MRTLSFVIPEEAVPKARARTYPARRHDGSIAMRDGKPVMKTRTPDRTKAWEQCVAIYARKAAVREGLNLEQPYAGPVELGYVFYFATPSSWSAAEKAAAGAGEKEHISDPDLSNLVKAIEDGCEGVLYKNDKQICRYVDIDGMPSGKYYTPGKSQVVVLVRYCSET